MAAILFQFTIFVNNIYKKGNFSSKIYKKILTFFLQILDKKWKYSQNQFSVALSLQFSSLVG